MTRIAFHPGCLFYGVRKLACAITYCFIILCFVCAMLPSSSHAHRMLIDCMVEGETVLVDVFFPDGRPAKNVKVEVYKPDDTLYISGETDEEGRFSFDAGDKTQLKVTATGELGHKAEQELSLKKEKPLEDSEEASPARGEVKRRVAFPFREVFAGFGYILGVAGILMYLKGRSDLKKANVSSGDR
jgi:hypothetical protein